MASNGGMRFSRLGSAGSSDALEPSSDHSTSITTPRPKPAPGSRYLSDAPRRSALVVAIGVARAGVAPASQRRVGTGLDVVRAAALVEGTVDAARKRRAAAAAAASTAVVAATAPSLVVTATGGCGEDREGRQQGHCQLSCKHLSYSMGCSARDRGRPTWAHGRLFTYRRVAQQSVARWPGPRVRSGSPPSPVAPFTTMQCRRPCGLPPASAESVR